MILKESSLEIYHPGGTRWYQVVPVICLELKVLLHTSTYTCTVKRHDCHGIGASGISLARRYEGKWCCWRCHVNSEEQCREPLNVSLLERLLFMLGSKIRKGWTTSTCLPPCPLQFFYKSSQMQWAMETEATSSITDHMYKESAVSE